MTMLSKENSEPMLSRAADKRRLKAIQHLIPATKSALGQFMTSTPIAEFMAAMFSDTSQQEIRLLDPGAGVGSLTAAFIQRACSEPRRPRQISVTAFEVDSELAAPLRHTLEDCAQVAKLVGIEVNYHVIQQDFIHYASEALEGGLFLERPSYTHVITNPPYKKIQSASLHRRSLRRAGIEATNLYAAFVALAIKLLAKNGELVAITPRSFANGPYFFPFRKILASEASIHQLHVLVTRDVAFRDDKVLQENIIYHVTKAAQVPQVVVTTSRGAEFKNMTRRQVDFDDIIHPQDAELVIRIPAREEDAEIVRRIQLLTNSLDDLGIAVSTGPVVDFRLREFIHHDVPATAVPLIYAAHFKKGIVVWPKPKGKKPNSIDDFATTRKWLLPNGFYTLTRRFSSKEEKRRVIAAIFDPGTVVSEWVGFENHLNVFHSQGRGLSALLARGLAVYLNSTIVDQFVRLFNGHTQVNASDLRSLPYPSQKELIMLGKQLISDDLPPQEVIDELIEEVVFAKAMHELD